jgi:hypothetical protein
MKGIEKAVGPSIDLDEIQDFADSVERWILIVQILLLLER